MSHEQKIRREARRRETEQKMTDAVRRRQELKEQLSGRTGPAEVGDVFLLPGRAVAEFRWAVVLKHPDRPLLYAVPADTNPLTGSADVEVSQGLGGPMTLRCSFGLWVAREKLAPGCASPCSNVVGWSAPGRSSSRSRGRLEGSASQHEVDASPEYDRWLGEVAGAVDALEQILEPQPVKLSGRPPLRLIVSEDNLAGRADDVSRQPEYALAAAPELEDLLDTGPQEEPRGWEVATPCPGRLLLVPETEGVSIRYLAEGGEEPPTLSESHPEGQRPVAWKHTPDRKLPSGRASPGRRDGLSCGSGASTRIRRSRSSHDP